VIRNKGSYIIYLSNLTVDIKMNTFTKKANAALNAASEKARKVALITGVTGQDGAYLAEFLLEKGYVVHGVKRRSSLPNTARIEHLLSQRQGANGPSFFLHEGDVTDSSCISRIVGATMPYEIYNLAAQSHVGVSFEEPEYTADVDALGPLRILEAIRIHGLEKVTRFYQASSSELFGHVREIPQRETTPFAPCSPYAAAKLYAYWITSIYRDSYQIYACNGILFNHESARRGEEFVTRKITRGLTRIALGLQDCLYLGNLDAKRDWGHARDYVEMQWLMLQQERPDDYVIATGHQHSVRDFVNAAATELGICLKWRGSGQNETAIIESIDPLTSAEGLTVAIGQVVVKVDAKYFRPSEVETLLGDALKAREKLDWKPKVTFEQLVSEMTRADFLLAKQDIALGAKLLVQAIH
jgi:GDPmannose 4,6-dehydratase